MIGVVLHDATGPNDCVQFVEQGLRIDPAQGKGPT